MNELQTLCHKYTSLSENDIQRLEIETQLIEKNDDYRNLDVFIDVRNEYNKQAMVVYHKKPRDKSSLYLHKVVGQDALRANEPGVFRTLETQVSSDNLLARTQEERLIQQRVFPILSNEQTIGVTIVESDISKSILNDFKSDNDESKYGAVSSTFEVFNQLGTNIANQLTDAILCFNESGFLVLANNTAFSLYKRVGYIGNILGLTYDNLSIDGSYFQDVIDQLRNASDHEHFQTLNFSYLDYYFVTRKFWSEEKNQLIVLIQDRTDVKQKEAEIISKSVAIREINHRVKNNLQSVISLLRIQQRRLNSDEAKAIINESIGRIMAIASTYELMSKQLGDETSLKSAIQLLVSHLVQLSDEDHWLKVNLDVDPEIKIDNDRMVTISVIVNELLQNTISHAFPDYKEDDDCQVTISGKIVQSLVTIHITDNGVGFDASNVRSGSLGLTIIRSYVKEKLFGKLKIESSKQGTDISFSFDQKSLH